MSAIQHIEAKKLLAVIQTVSENHEKLLTYQSAAERLGRPKNNARMVAQVCDLLDAAAALAGVPLLALVAVREKSGDINRMAWAGWNNREEIISCSLHHQFSKTDFEKIDGALKTLEGKSNRVAWEYVRRLYSEEEILARLTFATRPTFNDAIDDLGTDTPDRKVGSAASYSRDQKIRSKVKERAKGKCEYCGAPGFATSDGTPYLECHHIIALAKDGADRMSNVIALCANDHREAHFGIYREEIEKRMIEIVRKFRG